ncbi:MAG: hypothetical protein LIO86_13150 [Lachnospiraceae bacterium]|nr:hypothetical protein [Lachnospiraceae bacterium]
MLAIDVRQVNRTLTSMENCLRKLEALNDEVDQVSRKLREYTEMEDVVASLHVQTMQIGEQNYNLKRMTDKLADIAQIYNDRETAIAGYAEEADAAVGNATITSWEVPGWIFQILGQEG